MCQLQRQALFGVSERLPPSKAPITFTTARFRKAKIMAADHVYLQAPYGGEIQEVEATAEVLVPLLVKGWHQVPAPADHEAAAQIGIIKDAE